MDVDKVLLVFGGLTVAAYGILALVWPQPAREGLNQAGEMLLSALPWMMVSMLAAGLVAQFFEATSIARWLGRESGIAGVVIGATLGLLGTGSRWAAYPLAASLLAAEAGLGPVFAFMTSWQLVSLTRLPAEVPFFGVRFTLIRAIVSFLVAVIGGMLVDASGRLW